MSLSSDWKTAGTVETRHAPQFRLQSVPLRAVTLAEGFWRQRRELNTRRGMPRFLASMEEHGVLDNFRYQSGRKTGQFKQASFISDSDVYKWLEGACWTLVTEDLPELKASVDAVIDEIAAAQGEDGYLATHVPPERRWKGLAGSHELYCLGHLIQAGIAHHRATGEETLLGVARRFADLAVREFGPGKIETPDGHPEVEMALVELFRETGEQSYLDLAGFLLHQQPSEDTYPPLADRDALVGHCVRSGYLCCGGADWYAETGESGIFQTLERLWQDLVQGKMYVTGGVGQRFDGESFGLPYELPNRAYAETCAQIAHAMWAWRMLLLTGQARFADVMELILYNGFLSGVSLSGAEYFYMNPLSAQDYQRSPWFRCNCCPPNIHRTLAMLPGYMFSTSSEGVWVHLYDACEALLTMPDGTVVRLEQQTQYPWEGEVELIVTPAAEVEFTLFLRIPGWAEAAQVTVNGQPVSAAVESGTYVELRRRWQPGDRVQLSLPMPPRVVEPHPRIAEVRGSVALARGPLVYCFESVDSPAAEILDLALAPTDAAGGFTAESEPELLGGVTVLRGTGRAVCSPCAQLDELPLYRSLGSRSLPPRHDVTALAIPYYAWANRGPSTMRVWLPREV